MSKKTMNKTISVSDFPETEVIIEDCSLEFHKYKLLQEKNNVKNKSEIFINDKKLLIDVPKNIFHKSSSNKTLDKKQLKSDLNSVVSPSRDIIISSPKNGSGISKLNTNEKINVSIKSPQTHLINSPKIDNFKNEGFLSPKGNKKNEKLDKEKLNKKSLSLPEENLVNSEPETKEFKEFKNKYTNFINTEKFDKVTSKLNKPFINNNYQLLYKLYIFIKENGGYSNVILYNKLQNFTKIQRISDTKSTYLNYLSHFYLYEEKQFEDTEVICNYDESYINEIPIITCPLDPKEKESKLRECFKYDMVILRGFYDTFNIDEKLFSISEIHKEFQAKYGSLVCHHQSVIGFNKKENLEQKEARSYSLSLDFMPNLKNELERKISPIIFSNKNENALKYAGYASKNNSFITLTNHNSFFGGNEQECRFVTFNLNHGPEENVWYGVNSNDAPKFRKIVKNQHNLDIFSKEIDWFSEIEFFCKNRINLFYGKTQKGDIILIGLGCLYWLKTINQNVNTTWNFCMKTKEQFKASYEKEIINKMIKQEVVVSISQLFYDLVDNEIESLDTNLINYASEVLKPKIQISLEILSKIKNKQIFKNIRIEKSNKETNNKCMNCRLEIFILSGCYGDNVNYSGKYCLTCFEKITRNVYQDLIILYNYKKKDLKIFLSKLNFNPKFYNDITNERNSSDYKIKQHYKSNTLNNISTSSIYNIKENIDSCRAETFQLLEINLEQDFKSPLDNHDNTRTDQDEYNLDLPFDSKFSPLEDKRIEMLENVSDIWNLEDNRMDVLEYVKSPKKTLFEDFENSKKSNFLPSKLKIQMDINESPAKHKDISFLVDKSGLENKSDLKKQFVNDEPSNIENNNLNINNMGNKVIIQVNQLNNLNIIQHHNSPTSPVNTVEKKDYVKLKIKDDIKSLTLALGDLRNRNARSIKTFKSDSGINNGINILKKYLKNDEVVKEYKLEKFVLDISNNPHLIRGYRDMFKTIHEEYFVKKK